jgi:hypothetical protein
MEGRLKSYQDKEAEIELQKAEAQRDWEKVKSRIKEAHDAEVQALNKKIADISAEKDSKISTMEKKLQKNILRRDMVAAIAEAKGNIEILSPHVERFLSMEANDDGDYEVAVIDPDSKERKRKFTQDGKPMTISDLLNEMKAKPQFQGDGIFMKEKHAGGSNANSNTGDNNNDEKNPWTKEHFNLTEQARLLKKNRDLANKMKKQAGY